MHPCKAVARRVQEPAKGMLHSTLGDREGTRLAAAPDLACWEGCRRLLSGNRDSTPTNKGLQAVHSCHRVVLMAASEEVQLPACCQRVCIISMLPKASLQAQAAGVTHVPSGMMLLSDCQADTHALRTAKPCPVRQAEQCCQKTGKLAKGLRCGF